MAVFYAVALCSLSFRLSIRLSIQVRSPPTLTSVFHLHHPSLHPVIYPDIYLFKTASIQPTVPLYRHSPIHPPFTNHSHPLSTLLLCYYFIQPLIYSSIHPSTISPSTSLSVCVCVFERHGKQSLKNVVESTVFTQRNYALRHLYLMVVRLGGRGNIH